MFSTVCDGRDLMRYESFAISDGLPSNRITSIGEDEDGVIWFATWNGLCSWNGKRLKSYVEDEDGNKFGRLSNLQVLPNGLLFVTNDAHDSIFFDPRVRKICSSPDSVPMSVVASRTNLADIVEGDLGLTIIRNGDVYQLPYNEGIRHEKQLHSFYEDTRGEIWMDFRNHLYHIWFEPSPFFYHHVWPGEVPYPFQSTVRALYSTSEGRFVAASRVNRLYGLSDTIVSVPFPGNVYKMVEDERHRFWLALRKKGLYVWSREDGMQPAFPDLQDVGLDDAFTLLKLRQQSKLWVGTWGKGIKIIDIEEDTVRIEASLYNDSLKSVHMFLQLQNGLVGACTTRGFHLFSQTGTPVYVALPDREVLCAIEMPEQQLLFSVMGHGLCWMSPNGAVTDDKQLNVNGRISAMYLQSDSVLWMVAETRLYRYSLSSGKIDMMDENDFGEEVAFSEETVLQYRDTMLCVGAASGFVELNLIQIDEYLKQRQKRADQAVTETILLYTFIILGLLIIMGLILWILYRGLVQRFKTIHEADLGTSTNPPASSLNINPDEEAAFRAKVDEVMESAIGNAMVDISLLSKMMDMPKNTFYYRCNEVYQTSPAALLQDRRMERALQLLRRGECTVREVAFQVGFNDPKYFSKVFKAKVGISPSQVQKDSVASMEKDESSVLPEVEVNQDMEK